MSEEPPKQDKPPEKLIWYGVKMKPGTTELQANIALFAGWDQFIGKIRPTTRRSDHFWWLVEYFWGPTSPKPFHRNPWAEKQVEEYCAGRIVSVSGCASSGKTTTAALWALLSWACSPEGTKVIVTSTSIKGARNRIWGQIREFHSSAGYLDSKNKPIRLPIPGVVVDSIGVIRLDKKKDGRTASQMSTIELIAAEQSQEKEAVDKLIGIKNDRVLFILDEAPDLSPSVLSAAFGNLTSNPNFQLIALGNFKSINDTFGMLSTPVEGWNSVSVDTPEWETVFQGQRGKCIRFDGTQSPNVIAGENRWKGLYSIEKFEKDKAMGENTIEYWRFCRSFVVPANVSDRVFSESDFIKGGSLGKARWKAQPIPVCSLDPAFTTGGDKSIGVLGLFGEDETGKWVLDIKEVRAFRENIMDSSVPFDFQIASQWRDWAKANGVSPSNAAFDCTGSGISFGSIVSQIWSPQVYGVAFGGAASDRPVSESDPTKCRDAYMNRCSEIWFQGKEFVRAGQVRGVTREISEDLVERKRSDKERGTKVGVEPKRDMKTRTGKSPDYGDSALILIDLLRERHGWTAGRFGKALEERAEDEEKWRDQADSVYDENALLIES